MTWQAGAVPSPEALAKLRALSPTDFESIFGKGSESKRETANEQWHRILESILNSNRQDIIDALKRNLVVFNRVMAEQSEQIQGAKRGRKGRSGGTPRGARTKTKNT